jgi:hypothetical protein
MFQTLLVYHQRVYSLLLNRTVLPQNHVGVHSPIHPFIHSFIPLVCAERDDSLPFCRILDTFTPRVKPIRINSVRICGVLLYLNRFQFEK